LGPIGTELKTERTEQKETHNENNTEKRTATETGKSKEAIAP